MTRRQRGVKRALARPTGCARVGLSAAGRGQARAHADLKPNGIPSRPAARAALARAPGRAALLRAAHPAHGDANPHPSFPHRIDHPRLADQPARSR